MTTEKTEKKTIEKNHVIELCDGSLYNNGARYSEHGAKVAIGKLRLQDARVVEAPAQ